MSQTHGLHLNCCRKFWGNPQTNTKPKNKTHIYYLLLYFFLGRTKKNAKRLFESFKSPRQEKTQNNCSKHIQTWKKTNYTLNRPKPPQTQNSSPSKKPPLQPLQAPKRPPEPDRPDPSNAARRAPSPLRLQRPFGHAPRATPPVWPLRCPGWRLLFVGVCWLFVFFLFWGR